jgi:competence protein ComEC
MVALWRLLCLEFGRERANFVLFIPVFLACGIGLRFVLEARLWPFILGVFLLLLLLILLLRIRSILLYILLILALGYLSLELRIWSVQSHILDSNIRPLSKLADVEQVEEAHGAQNRSALNVHDDLSTGTTQQFSTGVEFPKRSIEGVWLEGDIVQIVEGDNGHKILLDNIHSDERDDVSRLKYIRFNTRSYVEHLEVGGRIKVWVTLMPPPGACVPGGFSFARYAYFKGIGAIGYAKSRIYTVHQTHASWSITKLINGIRARVKSIIHRDVPPSAAGVVTALLIGDSSGISKEDFAAIRQSGIAHIMAISGMHIMIVVGCIFFAVRFIMVRIAPVFSSYYDSKKIAAYVALIASFCYLLLAGSPVSAQRAFIMAAVVLGAVILGRDQDPFRAIASAAIGVLLLFPESLLSASFQMSFAAALSLISAFGAMRKYWPSQEGKWYQLIALYCTTTTFSSLIAGLATTPFVIYHFNQFSMYSLLTNLIAVPLTNFVTMPLGIISMLSLPLGIGGYILTFMGWSAEILLQIAHVVSKLEGAWIYIPSLSAENLIWIALGGTLLCIMVSNLRFFGILIILFGFYGYNPEYPDVMIEKGGDLFAIRHGERYYFSTLAKARFVRNSWQQHYGIEAPCKLDKLTQCDNGV